MIKPNKKLQVATLSVGFFFLYAPILSLIVYSFNDSQLVTIWSRISLRWYYALAEDDELINAAWLSLKIGLLTAFASVVIGTWAGFVLARMGRFRGFTLYSAMVNAPLVIPEVIQGYFIAAAVCRDGQGAGLAGRTRRVHHLDRPRDVVCELCGHHRAKPDS